MTTDRRRVRFPRLGRRGSITVEFALVGLTLFTFVMITIEVCYDLAVGAALDAGAHAASRFGITGATTTAGSTGSGGDPAANRMAAMQSIVVQNGGGLLSMANLQMAQSSYVNFASASTSQNASQGAGASGQVVSYTLTYTQPYLTPIVAGMMGSANFIHTSTLVVLNEPY